MSQQRLLTEGLVGPFELADKSILPQLSNEVLTNMNPLKDRHCNIHIVKQVFFDSALQLHVTKYFGEDLKLWRSNFFVKQKGSGEIGWHHDRHFENGDESINFENINNHFSILIAITDIDTSGGVFEYIEGSHLPILGFDRDPRPFHMKPAVEHFSELSKNLECRKKTLPLKRGQFALFHSALLHHSQPFIQGNTRISMVGRLVREGTKRPEALAPSEAVITFN